MKSAWEALHSPWREWYAQRLTPESYFPDPATFRAEVRHLLRALYEHDRVTALHSLQVSRYAVGLAAELGLDRLQRAQLVLAAKLHDVGKLAVPLSLLNKPGRLTGDEYRWVQGHAVFGERMAQALTPCPAVQRAVRWHHERHDGTGYPDGLRGDDIPLFARLLAVADAFDAMTRRRPYAPVLSCREGLEELRRGAGGQFHPDVVAAFAPVLCRAGRR